MNLENSLYKITSKPFFKELVLPASKSHANRALIIGAVYGNGFTIHDVPESSDVVNMINCLRKAGLEIVQERNSFKFINSFPECEESTVGDNISLNTGDGGTTNRFLLALLSKGKKSYHFFPAEKINERPIDDLIDPLRQLQVDIQKNINGAWISVKGPAVISNHALEIECGKSTQFASAIMLAFSNTPLKFKLKNILASETYLKMTEALILKATNESGYTVPVDFSSLGYPLALALVNGKVLLKNCQSLDQLQPDSELIQLMIDSGADISWLPEGLKATSKNKLKPFNVDGSRFPDLVPTLAFLASKIEGKSTIRNLSILRHKESDRLKELIKILRDFSVSFNYSETADVLLIEGSRQIQGPLTIHPPRDHRMVMVNYLFLRTHSGGMLYECDCVLKSFPDFFKIMEE